MWLRAKRVFVFFRPTELTDWLTELTGPRLTRGFDVFFAGCLLVVFRLARILEGPRSGRNFLGVLKINFFRFTPWS